MQNPVMAALDVPSGSEALALAREIAPHVGGFKVGGELFTAEGPAVVRDVKELGRPVFLDLKFHDIPNTVAAAVRSAVRLGVDLLTVHTAGGSAMLRAAEEAARDEARRLARPAPVVLGVTVLTSMDDATLAEVAGGASVARQVEVLARLAVTAGLRGLVCSPHELRALRGLLPAGFTLVTPGIRPGSSGGGDDQKRTMTPVEALSLGATWLVIGRPIYAAENRAAAARMIASGLASGR
ncbi:MAG: orotidine-5'-phosphate decarboxylase [Limisphaerales bacterium]